MASSLRIRTWVTVLFVGVLSLAAAAQPPGPGTTEWENEALKLRLFYPSDLVKADTEQVIHDGHLTLFGISGASNPKLAEATNCLRPLLLLELPHSAAPMTSKTQPTADGGADITITRAVTATLLLAELDIDCLNAQHESSSTTLLNDMAEIVTRIPGMKSIAQPATYTIGWQKVHMAAAQGQPPTDPASNVPSQLYTMALSTNWNNHLLVWYFSSNSIDTLNRITKTTVRFGNDKAAPLYPLVIGNATP
jgi:hypothetical protein